MRRFRSVLVVVAAVGALVVAPARPASANPGPNAFAFVLFGNILRTYHLASPGTPLRSVLITGTNNVAIAGIDVRPATGELYGITANQLWKIDPATGVATPVGGPNAFTLTGVIVGFDFNPTVDRIRVVANDGQNIRLNPNTGTLAASDSSLQFAPGDPNEFFPPVVAAAAYTDNVPNATATTLYDLDVSRKILARQDPPNNGTLHTVGSLGIEVGPAAGFDILTLDGTQYPFAVLTAGGVGGLYTVNLVTGLASLVGALGGGGNVVDLAIAIGSSICAAVPPPPPGAVAAGTEGDDVIYGAAGEDVINALGGNDIVFGLGAHDTITGGALGDTLCGGEGPDRLEGGPGTDTLSGDAGHDWLIGFAGNDVLFGGPGADDMYGDDGDDYLSGGPDNDRLNGGLGTNILVGGTGFNACINPPAAFAPCPA